MQRLQVGVHNLGRVIQRRGRSALDTHIIINEFHDIVSIVELHPELNRILLPGYSAIHSTARSFVRYLAEQGIPHTTVNQYKPEAQFSISFQGRSIDCIILNSTSTASRVKYDFLLEQFRRHLVF